MYFTFAICVLGFQACLVQNVYSQCLNSGAFGASLGRGFGSGLGLGCASESYGAIGLNSQVDMIEEQEGYGGTGVGDVFVNGLLPVEGYSTISAQVPILGVVRFDGPVAAKGTVSISGGCGCGCQQLPPANVL